MKLTPFVFLLLFLIWLPVAVFGATTGKISGIVEDAETGEALPGANVVLLGTSLGASTDLEGRYFIINIPPGVYNVQVSFIGYKKVTQSNVRVNVDRTTSLDFSIEREVVAGEEVTIVSQRPKIQQDVSFTQFSLSGSDVQALPVNPDVRAAVSVNAGVAQDPMGMIRIRGGSYDEVSMYVDGFNANDARQGNPEFKFSNSEIQEIQVLKGGFNAEYGRAQSGVVNIVTKTGGDSYSFNLDSRMSPGARKHFGPNIYSPDDYWYVGRFLTLEPGEDRNNDGVPDFEGWNQRLADAGGVITYSMPGLGDQEITSANQALEIWQRQHPQWEYGDKPDYNAELTLSGPVPGLSDKTSFLASGYYDKAYYLHPFVRDNHLDGRINLRLQHKIGTNMTLKAFGGWNQFQGVAIGCCSGAEDFEARSDFADPRTFTNAHVFRSQKWMSGNMRDRIYTPDSITKESDVKRFNAGIGFTHILNPASFYEVKVRFGSTRSYAEPGRFADVETVVETIDGFQLNELPNGFYGVPTSDIGGVFRIGEDNGRRDRSKYTDIGFDFDYTNQINNFNQIKLGIGFIYSNQDLNYGIDLLRFNDDLRYLRYVVNEVNYQEAELYAQDRIEFLGMIMNLGMRLDYFKTDSPAFTDPYSQYYTQPYNYVNPLLAETPNEEGGIGIPGGEGPGIYGAASVEPDAKVALSPRLGISHPISENSKFFFNYGYFYQRAEIFDIAHNFVRRRNRSTSISNADLDFRKTVTYEAGVEQNISGMFDVTLSGYYRDVTQDIRRVTYEGSWEGNRIGYNRPENTGYADIRGIELSVDYRLSPYVLGFLNYDYALQSGGRYGFNRVYQDPNRANEEVDANIDEAKARPRFRANLLLRYPTNRSFSALDKILSGASMSGFFSWRSGEWITYHSENYPGIDANNIHWKSTYLLDLELTKPITLANGFRFDIYLQVFNALNSKFLDPDTDTSFGGTGVNPIDRNEYLDRIAEQGLNPGDYEGNAVVEATLQRGRYWLQFNQPRDIWLGLRIGL
jgi:outer membrane receptor protein involved in Fe transport